MRATSQPETVPRRSALSLWLQVGRIESLAVSSIAVLVGAAVAFLEDGLSPAVLLAWLGAVTAQEGTNLMNVSHNYKAGVGAGATHVPDPKASAAVVWSGQLSVRQVRRAALLSFGVCFAAGAVLAWLRGWEIVVMGLAGLAAGYFYSAPPLRLARRGLGVIVVFVFIGPVMVMGTVFAALERWPLTAVVVALPIGLLAASIMHINDMRDHDDDLAHGKLTLCSMLGMRGAVTLLAICDSLAFVLLLSGMALGVLPLTLLVVLPALPLVAQQVRRLRGNPDKEQMRRAWLEAVRLHTAFGVLLIAGLAAGGVLRRWM